MTADFILLPSIMRPSSVFMVQLTWKLTSIVAGTLSVVLTKAPGGHLEQRILMAAEEANSYRAKRYQCHGGRSR